MNGKACCAPERTGGTQLPGAAENCEPGEGPYLGPVVDIPGGKALVGTQQPVIKVDGEGPQRSVRLKPFRMGATSVTRAAFAAFVEATGYVTEAETFGWSFVFHAHVPQSVGKTHGIDGAQWWRRVDGANWRDAHGPGGDQAPEDHPVVQVSWHDAMAFAAWCGGRLPTEAEWEHAARGGLGNVTYPWGDKAPNDRDHFPCNIWQGRFPTQNTGADGHDATAPAQSYAPNGYGLFNMAGNVWDWTADDFRVRSLSKAAKAHAATMAHHKVIKGGSFLCHESYCTRYRIAARTGNTPDSATSHMGFRVVFDP